MKLFKTFLLLAILITTLIPSPMVSAAFERNRIMDDTVFNNFGSMSAGQIDGWLNGFPSSCISPNRGFKAPDVIGYSPNGPPDTGGYVYGGDVSAGSIIEHAASVYGLNPQVILATLEKESSLVSGELGCPTWRYVSAMGYLCTDSETRSSYSGIRFYSINGNPVTSIESTCVESSSYAGFSRQVLAATWQFKFDQQRSRGNVNWNVQRRDYPYAGNVWDNSDDPTFCYTQRMTQGFYQTCPNQPAAQFDGLYSIDGVTVRIDTGPTAASYNYTPHFPGPENFVAIFERWFGSTKTTPLPGCTEATNTQRACVWFLTSVTTQPYYTASVDVRNWLVDIGGYTYHTKAFFGNSLPLPGDVPIYRLEKQTGGSFLTASLNEYNTLTANGFIARGVDFYASPGSSNSGYPVYRLYHSGAQIHQWAASASDRDSLIAHGYSYEGIAFTSISAVKQETPPPAGQELVYRFGQMPGNGHFWTRDVYERDQMIKAGYRYEGVAWRASQSSTAAPVYRLYSPSARKHLFTKDAWERQVLVGSQGWRDEGVAWYSNPSSAGAPVYRLYSPTEHFFTTDAWERSVLVSNGLFRDEGAAWYQP